MRHPHQPPKSAISELLSCGTYWPSQLPYHLAVHIDARTFVYRRRPRGKFGAPFHAVNPATGEQLEPAFYEVDRRGARPCLCRGSASVREYRRAQRLRASGTAAGDRRTDRDERRDRRPRPTRNRAAQTAARRRTGPYLWPAAIVRRARWKREAGSVANRSRAAGSPTGTQAGRSFDAATARARWPYSVRAIFRWRSPWLAATRRRHSRPGAQ